MASHMFCAHCQRLLPAGQTVCSFCEGEIRALPAITWAESNYPAPPVPDQGFFACPACHKHFEQCVQLDMPSLRWQSSQPKDACPHCRAHLQWAPIPATLALQRHLVGMAGAGSLVLLVYYIFMGPQALLGLPADSTIAKAVQIAVFISPYLIGFTMSSREDKMPRRQGRYLLRQSGISGSRTAAWTLSALTLYALVLYCTPTPWSAAMFFVLLLINAGAVTWLQLLNWRQRHQMRKRAQAA